MWGNGGELFDKELKKCTIDDERAVEGLQLMQDLRYKHQVAPDMAALQQLQQAGDQPRRRSSSSSRIRWRSPSSR